MQCSMLPANVLHNLTSTMEAEAVSSGHRKHSDVILIAIAWNVNMASRKTTLRRFCRRHMPVVMGMTLACCLLALGVVTCYNNQPPRRRVRLFAAQTDDVTKSRIKQGKFVLQPKQPHQSNQYYFHDSDNSNSNNNKLHYLAAVKTTTDSLSHLREWGYDALMSGIQATPECDPNNTLLGILITSAPGNFARRAAIRETWCSDEARRAVTSQGGDALMWQCVFLIGQDASDSNSKSGALCCARLVWLVVRRLGAKGLGCCDFLTVARLTKLASEPGRCCFLSAFVNSSKCHGYPRSKQSDQPVSR